MLQNACSCFWESLARSSGRHAAWERPSLHGWHTDIASYTPEGWIAAGPVAECGSRVTVPTACSTSGALCSASASGAPVTCTEELCSLNALPACPGSHHGGQHAAPHAVVWGSVPAERYLPPRSGGLTSRDTTPDLAAARGPGAGSRRPDPAGQYPHD